LPLLYGALTSDPWSHELQVNWAASLDYMNMFFEALEYVSTGFGFYGV